MTGSAPVAGETWRIFHSRKGSLTVLLLNDPGEWFDAEIVSGRARFVSAENTAAQRDYGMGAAGDTLTMRTSFVQFIERADAALSPAPRQTDERG